LIEKEKLTALRVDGWRCITDEVMAMSVRIPSGAMRPTLQLGQHLPVDVEAYRRSAPEIGDVVLFHVPWDLEPDRRPGDAISIRGGRVVRNGMTEPGDHLCLEHCDWSPECDLPETVTVPAGMFYLLGDNRGQSIDSRDFGPIPAEWIVGRVEVPNRATPKEIATVPDSEQ
jgi:signal peptidase I